jgi:hypothetical protein
MHNRATGTIIPFVFDISLIKTDTGVWSDEKWYTLRKRADFGPKLHFFCNHARSSYLHN